MKIVAGFSLAFAVSACGQQQDDRILEATESSKIVAAAGNGQLAVVKTLLQEGADPNEQECEDMTAVVGASCKTLGWTPLMVASGHGHKDIVSLLLSAGADPKILDGAGNTALWYAQQCDCRDIVLLLQSTNGGAPGS